MACSREPGHVGAGFGDDHVGDAARDPHDSDEEVSGAAKGFDHHVDPVGEVLDGIGVLIDRSRCTRAKNACAHRNGR